MSKLERKNHKVFGINATETKVGQFGSANATTKITTKDVEKIQALDAWEQGWEAGAVGNNRYPTQQERTGVDYEHSYQIGYMLQEGVPEWNKDTTYNKGSIVKAYNGTTLQNYVSLVDDNLNNAVTDIAKWKSGLANSDLSNLTEAGEKHFLNKSQVTNCLLEVPQRIKYTLVDGVLTILKGSICIVPYGTEDKTADLPKGATFINENFKVYDTQYTEDSDGKGKFFVWAELVDDMPVPNWETVTGVCMLGFRFDSWGYVTLLPRDNYSGDTKPTDTTSAYWRWYDTNANKIKYTADSGASWVSETCTLPFMTTNVVNGVHTSIDEVFNGMGGMASTIWVDKGVKGLAPNGRNADGSLNNLEYTTNKLSLQTYTNAMTTYLQSDAIGISEVVTSNYHETETEPTSPDGWNVWYKPSENIAYLKNIGDSSSKWTPQYMQTGLAEIIRGDNGKIISFAPKLPFRAADENDIDGRWMRQSLYIINGATVFPLGSYQYRDYDISNYLPNDGHIYELAVEILAFSGSSTNATSHWWASDILGVYQTCSCGGRAYSNVRDQQYANGIIPMASRTLRLYCSSTITAPTISIFRLCGYRKVR